MYIVQDRRKFAGRERIDLMRWCTHNWNETDAPRARRNWDMTAVYGCKRVWLCNFYTGISCIARVLCPR